MTPAEWKEIARALHERRDIVEKAAARQDIQTHAAFAPSLSILVSLASVADHMAEWSREEK
jgi:hypothetical protein